MRLVSFGCSYTWGSFLDDQTTQSWPAVLGKLLDCEFVNKGQQAASNLEIVWNILNFDFKKSDIVVVMWTHFDRDFIFDKDGNHLRMGSWNITKEWLTTHNDYDANIRNWMHISHAMSYLSNKKIKYYNVIGGDQPERHSYPSCIKPKNFIDVEFINYDFASDNNHPGPKSHAIMAQEIFNRIK